MQAKPHIKTIATPIILSVLLLNIIIVTIAAYMLFSSKQRYKEEVISHTQSLARALESSITGIYQELDLSLQVTAYALAESDIAAKPQSVLPTSSLISSIQIIDVDGTIIYSLPIQNNKSAYHTRSKPSFINHKQNSYSNMLIGKPVQNEISQAWEIPLSYQISKPDGAFDGIVRVTLPLTSFDTIFSQAALESYSYITLIDSKLNLITRYPSFVVKTHNSKPDYIAHKMQKALKTHPNQGFYKNKAGMEAYKKFDKYPLYITIGLDKTHYLKNWYQQVKITSLLVILFILTSAILCKLLTRLLYKQQLIQSRLTASQQQHESERNLLYSIIKAVPDLIWLKDLQGAYLTCNPRFESYIGVKHEEILGKTDYDLAPKSVADSFTKHDKAALKALIPIIYEKPATFKDGHSEILEITKTPVYNREKEIIGILGIAHDVTDRKQAQLREKSRSQLLELISKTQSLTEMLHHITHSIEQENKGMLCSILLLDDEGKHLLTTAAPSLPDFYNEAINGVEIGQGVGSCGTAAYTGQTVIVEDIASHPYWAPYKELALQASLRSCWSQPIYSSQQNVLGTFAIYHQYTHSPSQADIDFIEQTANLISVAIEKNRSEEQLRLSATVFSYAGESITITDTEDIIVNVNDTFTAITGYSREEVIGKPHEFILNPEHTSDISYKEINRKMQDKGYWQGEVSSRRKNGEIYPEMKTISAVYNAQGITTHYVSLSKDITPIKDHQRQLERIAQYDVLTNLPNRTLLDRCLSDAIQSSTHSQHPLAVVFLDLDGFKKINDTYGHNKGDQLLISLANKMRQALREGDTLGRLGGDEFVAILTQLDLSQGCKPILERLLEAASSPINIEGKKLQVSASIGVTHYPHDNVDADQLLRHADQAMYIAKQSGKNRYHFFDIEKDNAIKTEHESIEQIRIALSRKEFVLHYQPKVNMRSGEVIGVEALIRWQHPQQGLLAPSHFLPIIETHPLSIELGEWVLKTALTQLVEWKSLSASMPKSVSVNISPLQLQQDNFVDTIASLLAEHPSIEPENLELEVLETSALDDISLVSSVMKGCMDLGVNFALDDFGTGYSSLTYLKRLPANIIKIDQTFIRDMLNDADDLAIVEAVIALSKSFNRNVIAEGVETTEHGVKLLSLGCELAQGYGIAKPMPAGDLAVWVNNWQPDPTWRMLEVIDRSDL